MCLIHAEARKPKIAHFHIVVRVDEKIVGLDVSMHNGRPPVVKV